MADRKIRVLVNAVPLMNISTGIGRYLRCLYTEMDRLYGDRLEICYFDGVNVLRTMPCGPVNPARWSEIVDFFWKLPAYPSFLLRLGIHYKREMLFYRAAKNFDIYHEAGFFPFSVPSDIRIVFTLHDLSIMRFPESHPLERVLYFRLFLRKRCRNVDRFITVSEFSKKEIVKLLNIDTDRISVSHLAYDPDLFYPRSHADVQNLLSERGIPERYFLFVGSGDPRKNVDIIPGSLKKAGLREPLVIVGWSGWADSMSWDNVITPGYVSDEELACLYSGALGLILPSSYEGFGLPLLEAMACGCPVVASGEASLPEVAKDAAMYMTGPRDTASLAGILKHLASIPAMSRTFVEKGLKRAGEFSWSDTARITFDAFEKALQD